MATPLSTHILDGLCAAMMATPSHAMRLEAASMSVIVSAYLSPLLLPEEGPYPDCRCLWHAPGMKYYIYVDEDKQDDPAVLDKLTRCFLKEEDDKLMAKGSEDDEDKDNVSEELDEIYDYNLAFSGPPGKHHMHDSHGHCALSFSSDGECPFREEPV